MSETTLKAPRRERKDTLETRRQMVDAAEILFAEHGVDNVTLLDISRASGQKNRNAAQYHFGDKAGLINAVLDKHSEQISRRRQSMVEELAEEDSPSLRALVEAYVLPVTEHVAATDNSLAYLLINAQLLTSSHHQLIGRGRVDQLPEVVQLIALMDKVLPHEQPARRRARMLLVQGMLFHGLASFYAASPGADSSIFVETLCDSIEGVWRSASSS